MIRLNNVNKYYNKKKSNQIHVINNTSIELDNKGLVTFLGNSGCGKTTLLNAIGGLDKVDSGDIYIDDKKITTRSSSKKDEIRNVSVGYIFQNYNLIEDATVFDNVSLVLKMMGIKKPEEIEERVTYILKRVGIYKYRNRPAKMLSGGERQRVGIARAIVKNPKIIIADEPTGNLDSKNTIEIMNIIKAISKEKLVILVTHEREIAEFYASRIIEIIDGKIVKDRENSHDNDLDYRLENKIYLQDMPVYKELENENIKIKYYGDKENEDMEVKIVVKNNNIYVETNSKLTEGSTNMELVDDHYKKISKDIYEEYEFDYEKLIDDNFKPQYTSIFNPISLVANGFKKVFSYSLIKKILLVGFLLASMFVIYSISNIAGITNITNDKFITVNENYLTVDTSKVSLKNYKKYEKMDGVDYVIPGNSSVSFLLPLDDFYQTSGAVAALDGSLTDKDYLNRDDIIEGTLPKNKQEIVIDKMVVDRLLVSNIVQHLGLRESNDFVGRTARLMRLDDFTIVGIVDLGSPSIYTDKSMFINILANQSTDENGNGNGEANVSVQPEEAGIVDYALAKDIKMERGSKPKNDYEAVININLQYEVAIGKTVDAKVNNKKLTVVGYFSSKRSDNNIYVNSDTIKYDVITKSQDIVISPTNKMELYNKFGQENVKVIDNYQLDRGDYIDRIKKNIMATVSVGIIMLLISLIEIYLMLRSSFLSRVKEVGVLRAIGLKKKDVYKMFLGEIIAISTLTAIPAMTFMGYVLHSLSKIPYIGDSYLMTPQIFIFSLLLVFVFNIVVGLMPVFNTLRKTPAEILSRNDVN
ncbi:MAG: ABC transporter ATP-binding protein/permease [Anaerovoracaceae bacterium]